MITTEKRFGDWIQTFTGQKFYPLDPREDEIDILDIAHSLSMQCRFAGHCSEFYSIAEHCCHLYDWIDDDLKFEALLHDASEAYLVDIPRPVKNYLPDYKAYELALEKVIARKYGLNFPFHPKVKEGDNRILFDEKVMLPNSIEWDWSLEPIGAKIKNWPAKVAEVEFISRFNAQMLLRQAA